MTHDSINNLTTAGADTPQRKLGKYLLQRLLGRGGMGEVWLARDTLADIEVALKMLPPELRHSEEAQDQIRTSYQRVHKLGHPNICAVKDLVTDPGTGYFLVMDYFEGITLSKYRAKQGGMTVEEVVRLLTPVAQALDYAHSLKLAHRDIKPGNILVSPDGQQVRVIDFQLASDIRASVSRLPNAPVKTSGTYPYMAPEQFLGQRASAQTDLYALAMVAYELLDGQLPYEAHSWDQWKSIVTDERSVLPTISDIPPAAQLALEAGLSRDKSRRTGTCSQWILSLVANEPEASAPGARSFVESDRLSVIQGRGASDSRLQPCPKCGAALLHMDSGWVCHQCQSSYSSLPTPNPKVANLGECSTCGQKSLKANGYCNHCKTYRLESSSGTVRDHSESKKNRAVINEKLSVRENSAQPRSAETSNPKLGDTREITLPCGVKHKLIWCPPGTFMMGSSDSEANRDPDEDQVSVTLTKGFWLGQTVVTRAMWTAVMETSPWLGDSSRSDRLAHRDYPAIYISHIDAKAYCAELTKLERATGWLPANWEFSLPTEAMWEYACRAGTTTAYCYGDDVGRLVNYAWFDENADKKDEDYAHAVGLKKPNLWGFYDMHGNVRELCRDEYRDKLKEGNDPGIRTYGGTSERRCNLRGGCWNDFSGKCRAASRNWLSSSHQDNDIGFRVAITSEPVRRPDRPNRQDTNDRGRDRRY